MLIALFERSVGLYASLVNINAYHQPGVEAGKKGAENVLKIQRQVLERLKGRPMSATELASEVSTENETVFHICERLAANGRLRRANGTNRFAGTYSLP